VRVYPGEREGPCEVPSVPQRSGDRSRNPEAEALEELYWERLMFKTKTLIRRVVDSKALYRDIGRLIRRARERRKMSQEELASAIGVSRANLCNMEKGNQRILLEHVYNIALHLKRPVRGLLP